MVGVVQADAERDPRMMLQAPDVEMVKALVRQRDAAGLMALANAAEVVLDTEILATVAEGLGFIADPDSLPAVLHLARNSHVQVRVEAIGALAHFADPSAREAIRTAANDLNVV